LWPSRGGFADDSLDLSRNGESVMAESRSFASAFLPGLVVGLVVGSLLGAFLAPRLNAPDNPKAPPVTNSATPPADREPLPASATSTAEDDAEKRKEQLEAEIKGTPAPAEAPK